MKRIVWAACVAAMLGCGSADDSVLDFSGGTREVAAQPSGAVVALRTEEPAMVRGKNTFVLAPFGGTVRGASGFMPAHGHGTKPPTMETLPDGSQRVGLVLYMSGRWEVSFDLERAGSSESVRLDVQVP
jgi:hypothetical protein